MKGAYYAVARGKKPGVYRTWPECEKQVKGFQGARYKKFSSEREALDFISANGGSSVSTIIRSIGASTGFAPSASGCIHKKKTSTGARLATKIQSKNRSEVDVTRWQAEGVPVVFTDGACSSNGHQGAKAGIGVFWGDDHPDNVSEPLASGPPTNNRAELSAVITALKTAHEKKLSRIIICTDSNLLIKSMNSWIDTWRKNGWKTANGGDVKNKDLIVELDGWLTKVHFEHVAGHAGIYGNEKADELARNGALRYSA
ncbi:Ribonuclease H1 [Toxocara canis]|uniref:Ribonuclease H1 n=1 Tax=Toxocara canis TaxID=6265 RepID=A0A0B2UY74_TOXCA|nr:Ribonuclease H1 [Toxocara canis]